MPIGYERDRRGVGTITIDRPDKRNSLDSAHLDGLVEAAARAAEDAGLRVVVLRAAGAVFCGGADVREMAALDPERARGFITLVHRACDAMRRLPVPVIARLHGVTLGAGLEIAASCDIRLAGDAARFGMPEVRVGIPSVVEAALLPGLIGWGRTRWLLLTGETIGAADALGWGLVERVVGAAELDRAVEETVASILAAGPEAIRLQKRLIAEWEGLAVEAAVARGIECFAEAWGTEEPRRMLGAVVARLGRRG